MHEHVVNHLRPLMKKLIILILSLIILSCNKESAPSNLISLKLTEFKSYGPFPQMFSALDWTPLSEKGIWANTEIKTTGVPQTWTYSNVAQVWFDSHQFAELLNFSSHRRGQFPFEPSFWLPSIHHELQPG